MDRQAVFVLNLGPCRGEMEEPIGERSHQFSLFRLVAELEKYRQAEHSSQEVLKKKGSFRRVKNSEKFLEHEKREFRIDPFAG